MGYVASCNYVLKWCDYCIYTNYGNSSYATRQVVNMRSLLAFVDRRNAESLAATNFAASAAATTQTATDNTVRALYNNDKYLAKRLVVNNTTNRVANPYVYEWNSPYYGNAVMKYDWGNYYIKTSELYKIQNGVKTVLSTANGGPMTADGVAPGVVLGLKTTGEIPLTADGDSYINIKIFMKRPMP
jgi:hypothetical protein